MVLLVNNPEAFIERDLYTYYYPQLLASFLNQTFTLIYTCFHV